MNSLAVCPAHSPDHDTESAVSESKYTPGPWGLSKAIDIWVMAGPAHVATIPRAGDGGWSEANARLIAAAPDLLAAVIARTEARQFAAAVSAATPDGETPSKQLLDKADTLFARAEKLEAAAIAKAEGWS